MAKEKDKVKTSEESETKTKKSKKDEDTAAENKDSKKSKKDSNAAADKKDGKKSKKDGKKEPNKVAKWFKDLKIEFKKVVWPTKQTVITNTSVVLAVVAGSAVMVGVLDEGFLALMRLIYR